MPESSTGMPGALLASLLVHCTNTVRVDAAPVLQIGPRVFIPPHGVVLVLGVQEHAHAGRAQCFCVVALDRGKMLWPVDQPAPAVVRALVSPAKAHALRALIHNRDDLESGVTVSADTYAELLSRGAADDYTELLRTLLHRARACPLSRCEERVLRAARSYFVHETSAVLARPVVEIEEALV